MLDFDSDGYLTDAEILGPRSKFPVADVNLPRSFEKAVLRLASIPASPGTAEFSDDVSVTKSADGRLVLAKLTDSTGGALTYFALSDSVYIAFRDDRFDSILFSLERDGAD